MLRPTADTAKAVILIGVGALIFLAPFKFGMPINSEQASLPGDIFGWLIYTWPPVILQMGVLILFTLWLIWNLTSPSIKFRYSLLDIPIIIFLLTAVIFTFNAVNAHKAQLCLTQYLCYAAVYYLVLNLVDEEKDFRFFLSLIVVPSVFISVYAIYQYYIGLPETRMFASQYLDKGSFDVLRDRLMSNRVFATFVYPNTLAGYLFLCIPVVAASFMHSSRNVSFKANKNIKILIVLAMIYALSLTFYSGSGSAGKIKNTIKNRWEYWVAGVKMIKEHPVLGIGADNFGVLYPVFKLDVAEETRSAHNNFLQVWIEQGIFGFLAFCAIWFILLKKRNKTGSVRAGAKTILLGLKIGLILFLLHNLVDFDWYVPGLTIIAWVLIAIAAQQSGLRRKKLFKIKNWRIRAALLFLVLSCFLLGLIYLEKDFVAGNYLREAGNAFNKQNLFLAEVMGRASIRLNKNNPAAYFLLGKIYAANRNYPESISWYKKALQYESCNSAFYYNMALSYVYQMQGGGDKVLMRDMGEAFKDAVKYYPTNPFYRMQLAQFYEINKQNDLAIGEYNHCLLLNKKIQNEYVKYGKILKHLILAQNIVDEIKTRIKKSAKI